METMRKEWGSPISKIQMFTPQEFVAACDIFIPVGQISGVFWADMVRDNGYTFSLGKDGKFSGNTMEEFNDGYAPSALQSTAYGVDARRQWFSNMTLYTKNPRHTSIPSDTPYTDTEYFTPMSGYTNVAIYIGPKAVGSYIYKGNGGNVPDDPDMLHPTKTFS